jgi:hypothetical protein
MLAGPTPSGSADAPRLCRSCSHPHRHLPAQAAPSFYGLLRQPTGAGLPPPLKQQRLTAHETSPERVRHHLRRPLASSRNLLMKTAGNTVPVTDPVGGSTPKSACVLGASETVAALAGDSWPSDGVTSSWPGRPCTPSGAARHNPPRMVNSDWTDHRPLLDRPGQTRMRRGTLLRSMSL